MKRLQKWNWSRGALITFLVVVVILIAARAALPWFIKRYVNQTLDSIPGYYGYVVDVDVHLWRGAYSLHKIGLIKSKGKEGEPLFSADAVDLSVDWRALLNGRIVSKIEIVRPQLQFVQRADPQTSQTKVDESWQQKVMKLVPLEINRFAIEDGLIRYKDETRTPKINLYFSRLNLTATNISNATKKSERLPSEVEAEALFLKSGKLKVKARTDFLSEPAEADVNIALRDLNLPEINDFTKAYGNFDFEKGLFDVTTEIAASKTKYDGYVKTLARGIDVVDFSKERKEGDSVLHLVWEGLVGGVMDLFKNQKRDQFAARIPISGTRKEVEIGSWETLGSILRNAFIQALSPKFEESVSLKEKKK